MWWSRLERVLCITRRFAPSKRDGCHRQYVNSRTFATTQKVFSLDPTRTRNIGIIAHIDAGKTTTTERMLYYSGYTRTLGNVKEGSTVTDFLPMERARGITIQSAAITLEWPPEDSLVSPSQHQPLSSTKHKINLIDTPGHADFNFEVIRSLRVLDGAICILDAVSGVEAQTEIVWSQADKHAIPRLIYINKLDRDGASFDMTVKHVAIKLQVWPAICHIPRWKGSGKKFCGIGDVINLRALDWQEGSDGNAITSHTFHQLKADDPPFAAEMLKARNALVELLANYDSDVLDVLANTNDLTQISPHLILQSLRRLTLKSPQEIVPVFAGSSLKNIGIQPLVDHVIDLLPSPDEIPDPGIQVSGIASTLSTFRRGDLQSYDTTKRKQMSNKSSTRALIRFEACALAFKVVHDVKRGVLVYVRVYAGQIKTSTSTVYNTTLNISERVGRILRMYASDAVEVEAIGVGDIGVIVGLKATRTGDTLVCTTGMDSKTGPPPPINTLQLLPIEVPPPVFFSSIEPNSQSDKKQVDTALQILLREDPSLHLTRDQESGQTHLSGMGELHLEVASNRLIHDLKAKARIGKIEIGYRQSPATPSEKCLVKVDKDAKSHPTHAHCLASVQGRKEQKLDMYDAPHITQYPLEDNNLLTVHHPTLTKSGKPAKGMDGTLPSALSMQSILNAIRSGSIAALARGPVYRLPLRSTHVNVYMEPETQFFDDTTTGAIADATRHAVAAALRSSGEAKSPAILEPVMLVTIAVREMDIGKVTHDLKAARGATIISQGDVDAAPSSMVSSKTDHPIFTSLNLANIYRPPDPFTSGITDTDIDHANHRTTSIVARVPLKEMVGYLSRLRSMTEGRGSFVMQVDEYSQIREPRLSPTIKELRG